MRSNHGSAPCEYAEILLVSSTLGRRLTSLRPWQRYGDNTSLSFVISKNTVVPRYEYSRRRLGSGKLPAVRAIVPFDGTIGIAVRTPYAQGARRSPRQAKSRRSRSIRGKRSSRA